MRSICLLFIAFFGLQNLFAQNPGDTIVVQTFDYSMTYGSGIRDTMAYFPDDPNLTFEKIILSYNMRCKDDVVNTNGSANHIGCGAWDYSCNTYIHDSTRIDSLRQTMDSYSISNFSGNSYNYSINPVYNFIQFYQQQASIDSLITEDTTQLGYGTDSLSFVIATNQQAHKSQFIYRAHELGQMGLINDSIDALSLTVLQSNQWAQFLTIKMKLTTDSILSEQAVDVDGFTEVYNANTYLSNGLNRLQFHTPFAWDSTSNIIVEFSLTNSTPVNTTLIQGEQQSYTAGVYTHDAQHITLNGAENISIPTDSFFSIANQVTVSLWVYGNENLMPYNTSIFEGRDSLGNRTINVHQPWSNGRVYFDCGNTGSSYDRIDKAANVSDYAGGWNHWTFTKNASTGMMKIYLNGQQWHAGVSKTKTLDIQSFFLGSSAYNSNFWNGHVKELRIFDKELDLITIQNWMNRRMNSSHPDFNRLVAHYPLGEGSGTSVNDLSANNQTANFNGAINWNYTRGEQLSHFFQGTTQRPNLSFFQGEYLLSMHTDTVLDSLMASPNTVKEYAIVPHPNSLLNDSIATLSTNTYWEAISHTYDANGNLLNSQATTIDGTINIGTLTYYKRFPMAFQIMSFVTPYGAYLDLGPEGKTWHFDLTDFAPIFKGPKRITMDAGGQWQEDMDVKFLFIVGTPPRDVLDMQQLWKVQARSYTDIMADNAFEPRDYSLMANADAFKIRTVITGHGQEGEFIPQFHKINIDGGVPEFNWQVWTDCGENPIFPQGGTWIYDRAGWCPGQASDLQEDDITNFVTAGQTHTFDYGINSASGDSRYWVSSQLVSYDEANFTLDAAIVDILSPTDKVNYIRTNPICSKPEVVIQNTGSDILTSLTIEYWINNAATPESYNWSGSLAFLEKATVELPDPSSLWDDMANSHNMFYVRISNPNNASDAYAHNNELSTSFSRAPRYPTDFVVRHYTNAGAAFGNTSETSWKVLDNQGTVLYNSGNLQVNTLYVDTLNFTEGCYTFRIEDSDEDGIDFWANNDGFGYLRFNNMWGDQFFGAEGDFGAFLQQEFIASNTSSINETDQARLSVYPNPTNGELSIYWNQQKEEEVQFDLVNMMGETIWSETYHSKEVSKQLELSMYASGVYLLQVKSADQNIQKKVVLQ
jgi:hypothetical protein